MFYMRVAVVGAKEVKRQVVCNTKYNITAALEYIQMCNLSSTNTLQVLL